MKLITQILGLLLFTASIFASAADYSVNASISQEKLLQISAEKRWRQLLGYGSTTKSAITSSGFFLSAQGKTNPLAELEATLQAFRTEVSNNDDHPQCRFPARYKWLSHQLDFPTLGIQPISCPKYATFIKK